MCLETARRISAGSWDVSGGEEERFGRISRNQIRLNFHWAYHLFLVVRASGGCWSEAQPGATLGFGSKGWTGYLAGVLWCFSVWEEPAGEQVVFRTQHWSLQPPGLSYMIDLFEVERKVTV